MSRTYAHTPYRVLVGRGAHLSYQTWWNDVWGWVDIPEIGHENLRYFPRYQAVRDEAHLEHRKARRQTKDALHKIAKGEIDPDDIVYPEQKVLAPAMWWAD